MPEKNEKKKLVKMAPVQLTAIQVLLEVKGKKKLFFFVCK